MHRIVLLIFLSGVGCGDAGVASRTVPVTLQPGAEGRALHLVRRSGRCGSPSSLPLAATVGPGAEFDGRRVGTLESPCDEGPSPGVDIHVEATSVIFDFSGVDTPGVFPPGELEGYVIHFARDCPDMALASASVDAENSSIELRPYAVQTHYDQLEVNLEGVSYDDSSLLVVDL